MRRIRLVVAVAAMMVAMLSFSVPAMADVDLDDDLYEDGVLLYYDIDDINDLDDLDDLDDFDLESPVHLID
jgi:hypothetical protein